MNLQANPFYLNKDEIEWVENTLSKMSVDDKIKQLFIDMAAPVSEEIIKNIVAEHKSGGLRYMNKDGASVAKLIDSYQNASEIPLIVAANTEAGGNGACADGTEIGNETKIAATGDVKYAAALGEVSAKEAKAIGCNTLFAPIVDIHRNFRNPIIATRTFGNNEKMVAEYSKAYLKAAHKEGVACVCKHFPGDGIDERDQHLANSVNSLSCEEWDKTFGYVYKEMIDAGVEGIMVGHILLPAYERKFNPELAGKACMPATLSKYLLQDLLRKQLGFNGLIITDASHMVGMTGRMARKDIIPTAIAAGCDMFLFYNDYDEDIGYVKDSIKCGILSVERLDEAVKRILAYKAHLKLNKPQKAGDLSVIGCESHKAIAEEVSHKAITLVKSRQKNVLPLTLEKFKKILIVPHNSANPFNTYTSCKKVKYYEIVKTELENCGFNVEIYTPVLEQLAHADEDQIREIMSKLYTSKSAIKTFTDKYDLIIQMADIPGNGVVQRIDFALTKGSIDMPWYVHELPVIFISVNSPFHLIDVPQVQTYINCYDGNVHTMKALCKKLTCEEKFTGISPVDAFCASEDTKW
ncbi:MAG: beta-hexosaminidase [Roseburia sp.]|nr:beta-hexosaminidase [Roseburia sp.]